MKKLLALTICFMFVGVVIVFAEPLKVHTWELGTEISHIKYEEPGLMEEKGIMYGIMGSYTYHNRAMLRADGKWSWGEVDYSSPISGSIDDIDDYILEFRGLCGYDFPILTATILTPYIGFGYRYLNDGLDKVPTGYERESNYYYSPIGIETITELENGWSLGLTFEYDLFWQGKQKSHLSDARCFDPIMGYYTFGDIENDQEKGYGIRGSVKLQKKTEKVDLIIEPYIKYWNIKKSKEVTFSTISENGLWLITMTGVEPKNNSMEIGGKFAVKF